MIVASNVMSYHWKGFKILRLTEILKDFCKKNIQHVETSVASHRKQFEHPILRQSQVNYVQRLCRAST